MLQCSIGRRPSHQAGLLRARQWKGICMTGYEDMGENLLLAMEGNRQIAVALTESLSSAMVRLRQWIARPRRTHQSHRSASSPT